MKADLQTSSQRLNLSGGSGQPTAAELAPDDSIDDVIHHEVKELGTHMYVYRVLPATSVGMLKMQEWKMQELIYHHHYYFYPPPQ